jgi:hypothetical protein
MNSHQAHFNRLSNSFTINKMQKNFYHKRNKYRNVRQTYNGHNYDSKMEAEVAHKLDLMKKNIDKTNRVKNWERQYKISLDINGVHIANYFIDFMVEFVDGRKEFWEVKGMETDLWKLKWKMTKALFPEYNLVLIK